MRHFTWMLAALLSPAAPFAVAAPAPQPQPQSSNTETTSQEFTRRAEQELADLRRRLDDAEASAQKLSGQARDEARRQIAQLKSQREETEQDLDRVKRVGAAKAQKARQRLDSAIEGLRREYEGLRRDLEQKEPD